MMEPVAYMHSDANGGLLFFRTRPEIVATLPLWRTADQVQVDRMAEILQKIAYPKHGTDEDLIDIYTAARLIQDTFTLEQLEMFRGAR